MITSTKERHELTIKYEPLINKMTAQFYRKVNYNWADIKSMAYEGFALALAKFDPTRSNMNFTQYAAFAIRNNIMTGLTDETRTVKLPFEEQKKRKDKGETLFTSVSIDHSYNSEDDDNLKPKEVVMGMSEKPKFSDGNIFNYLYTRLESRFPKRECEMFYMTFGLKDYEETANKDIAKKFNVSEGLISQKKAKMIAYIHSDTALCEMLANLL